MHVYVTNRSGARHRAGLHPFAWISINSPGDPAATLSAGHSAVLRLWFHDIESAPGPAFRRVYGPPVLFNSRMAHEVVRFIISCAGQNIRDICVHCDAGVSRSGAVAEWLADTFNANVVSDFALQPNARVRRLLDRAWEQTAA